MIETVGSTVSMAAEFAQRKRLAYDERLEGEMAETNTSAETVTSEWVEGFRDRWWAAWNSHQLDPPGMPGTGKTLEWEGADFHDEYRDGKVARLRIVFDMSDTWRQLGLLPDGDSAG
jgi:hypothetical protein